MTTKKIQEIEEREGRPIRDILRNLYEKYAHDPATQTAVAKALGISQPTLSQWLMRLRLVQVTTIREEDKAPDCTPFPN